MERNEDIYLKPTSMFFTTTILISTYKAIVKLYKSKLVAHKVVVKNIKICL